MTTFSITLDETEVTKKIDGLTRGIKDFRKPLEAAGDDLLDIYGNRVFQEQGKPSGEPWRKLSAGTLMARQKRTGYYKQTPIAIGKILIWTGRLMKGFRKKVTKTSLTIDNTVDYFKYHQQSKGKPPQRRMLFINTSILHYQFLSNYFRNVILQCEAGFSKKTQTFT